MRCLHLYIIMFSIHHRVNHTQFSSPSKDEINPFNVFITLQMLDLNPVDLTSILVLILEFSLSRTWFLAQPVLVCVCSG